MNGSWLPRVARVSLFALVMAAAACGGGGTPGRGDGAAAAEAAADVVQFGGDQAPHGDGPADPAAGQNDGPGSAQDAPVPVVGGGEDSGLPVPVGAPADAAALEVAVDAPAPAGPAVVISELMYHPVLENDDVENHEFIELYNRTASAVSLAGWTLGGEVTFVFPPGASIGPHAYLAVARNRQALATAYGLDAATLAGDYGGQLSNGGGQLLLRDQGGSLADAVRYDDAFPWPIGADALGAGATWLPPALLPLERHQGKGRSLERYDLDAPPDVANWAPSPIDGATPGAPNTVSGSPPAIVTSIEATASGALIRAQDPVTIKAALSAGPVSDVRLDWFVDDLERTDEPVASVAMTAAAGGGWQATLGPQPDNAIVRYRLVATRAGASEILSPRPSDPYAWHAYFVSPAIATTARVYQLFISRANWTQLWDNIDFPIPGGRTDGCAVRASWQAKVPAVFVVDGVVYDAHVRYQGGRFARVLGSDLDLTRTTIAPLPDRPSPPRALAWNVSLPRYAPFEGRQTLDLNKLLESCPGMYAALGERLYAAVGVPAARAKFARLHINGGYYHYVMDLEHLDEDFIKRYEPGKLPRGDLFKSVGCHCSNDGPYGEGDERQLPPFCGYTSAQRYSYVYERKTADYRNTTELEKLIDGLAAARASLPDTTALRAFFNQTFDVPTLLSYIAVRNWSGAWDDLVQNHYLYRRPADGKWILAPTDLDLEFGSEPNAASSGFFFGEDENMLKDAVIKTFRTELIQRLTELDATVLAPASVKAMLDSAVALYSAPDALAAPAGSRCVPADVIASMRKFADDRHQAVLQLAP
jgi:hypothetical protein